MKIRIITALIALMIAAPLAAQAYRAPNYSESPKLARLKGSWFLRTPEKCVEVVLDRHGRSELLLGNREVYVDRDPDYLYMTIKRFPHTYTYRMNPIEYEKSYVLELVAAGPDLPATYSEPNGTYFTGAFRRMVDCQITPTAIEGGDSRLQPIDESNVGS